MNNSNGHAPTDEIPGTVLTTEDDNTVYLSFTVSGAPGAVVALMHLLGFPTKTADQVHHR